MIYNNSDFTLGIKWLISELDYNLTYTERAALKVAARLNTTIKIDETEGVVPMESAYAALIQAAFDAMTRYINLDASSTSQSNTGHITFSIVEGLQLFDSEKNEWVNSGGVAIKDDGAEVNGYLTDVDIIINRVTLNNIAQGAAGFETLMHEIGHALGLFTAQPFDHPHEINDNASYTHDNTIMSYDNGTVVGTGSPALHASTPMMYDIAALQHLYGAKSVGTSGDNTYYLDDPVSESTPRQAKTIWDAGGYDIIDASGVSGRDVRIDLRGGADGNNNVRFSVVGDRQKGNDFIQITEALAIAYQGDPNSTQPVVIEEARGGEGSDVLIAGYSDHVLKGNGGKDLLYAGAGQNTLYGGDGTDYLKGGGGDVDFLFGGDDTDLFNLAAGSIVMDATSEDFVMWGGQRLTGGTQFAWMEGGYAYNTPVLGLVEAGGTQLREILNVVSAAFDLKTSTFYRYGLTTSGDMKIQFARGRIDDAYVKDYDLDLEKGVAHGGIVAYKIKHVEDKKVSL